MLAINLIVGSHEDTMRRRSCAQGLIFNSRRWWKCTAEFSSKIFSPNVVKLCGTAFRLGNWIMCKNGVPPIEIIELTSLTGQTFSGPLPAIGHAG